MPLLIYCRNKAPTKPGLGFFIKSPLPRISNHWNFSWFVYVTRWHYVTTFFGNNTSSYEINNDILKLNIKEHSSHLNSRIFIYWPNSNGTFFFVIKIWFSLVRRHLSTTFYVLEIHVQSIHIQMQDWVRAEELELRREELKHAEQ